MNWFNDIPLNLLISQIFGMIGIAISLTIYAGKSRKSIICCKFISDAVWFVNYSLLSAYTGALLNVIAMARETVFYNREKKKWASSRAWLYIFIACVLISPTIDLISHGGFTIIPFFPAIGSSFAVISFYSKNTKTMRIWGFIAQVLWLIYGFLLFNPTGIISCSLTIASIAIGFFRELKATKKTTAEEVK